MRPSAQTRRVPWEELEQVVIRLHVTTLVGCRADEIPVPQASDSKVSGGSQQVGTEREPRTDLGLANRATSHRIGEERY